MSSKELQISDLRVRLQNAHAQQEVNAILTEITSLGDEASLLVPDLLTAIHTGLYLSPSTLVPIISCTKNQELLTAALHQDQWTLSTSETSQLLKAGFVKFESQILKDL